MDDQKVRLVCFELCGEKFAFDTKYLVEIVQIHYSEITSCFTPVPLVRGTWNYRDKSLYVIDLRGFFGLEEKETGAVKLASSGNSSEKAATKSIVIVNIQEHLFGLLTDMVIQVVPLGVFYEYPDLISTLPRRYFAGITVMNAELVILLAIEKFLNEHELQSLEATSN
jgi:chemotaxis signal transduction protein